LGATSETSVPLIHKVIRTPLMTYRIEINSFVLRSCTVEKNSVTKCTNNAGISIAPTWRYRAENSAVDLSSVKTWNDRNILQNAILKE
jgi:hypothetical protein